jgi:hypothetical protein
VVAIVEAMVWIDQRDVATQHLALASAALERATADPSVSRDVIETLTELRAMSVAVAKLAGVGISDDNEPTTR